MKMTAKRRRSKQQIKDEKQAEDIKKKEIAQKLLRINELENRCREMQVNARAVSELENDMNLLKECGLLRIDEQGEVHAVKDWNEH